MRIGAIIVEVRDIQSTETPPENADWVLVEKAGEKFVANGSASGINGATFYKPAAFDTVDDAIKSSLAWLMRTMFLSFMFEHARLRFRARLTFGPELRAKRARHRSESFYRWNFKNCWIEKKPLYAML
jgi:hypothetical protein